MARMHARHLRIARSISAGAALMALSRLASAQGQQSPPTAPAPGAAPDPTPTIPGAPQPPTAPRPGPISAPPSPDGAPSGSVATTEPASAAPATYPVSTTPAVPEYDYLPAPSKPPTHAPRFALWTGVRIGFQTFGNSFFRNEAGESEVTGNYIKPGLGTQLDVGVRLEKRYIPYVMYDRYWSFGSGRRFSGQDASAYAQFFGIGFRYLFGNPDFIAGFTDLSFGQRSVHVSAGGQSYSMRTFEYFRLALGAEVRLHTKLTISPQASLSSGVMNDTSGNVTYSPERRGDGALGPRYQDGKSIDEATSYIVFGLGVGAHFDLFGK